jgi:CHAT domain-containing protein
LYASLIAPVSHWLTTPRLVIVPHGPLHYLPFAMLYNEANGRYLIEDHTLVSLPTASALQFISARDEIFTSPLILGNPVTDLGALAAAEDEAKVIGDLLATSTWLQEEATEDLVWDKASEATLLHLAAHGVYSPTSPLNSMIALTPSDVNDGRLHLSEVYGLDLSQAGLVVLSACQTLLGDLVTGSQLGITAGDEVASLTRAFFFADASTVVATLWNVDDAATAVLMEHFYAHLQAGQSKAAALRQAQLDTKAEFPDPYYWAGFVLSGDGGKVEEEPLITPTAMVTIAPTPTLTPVPTNGPTGGGKGLPHWFWSVIGATMLAGIGTGVLVWWRKRP